MGVLIFLRITLSPGNLAFKYIVMLCMLMYVFKSILGILLAILPKIFRCTLCIQCRSDQDWINDPLKDSMGNCLKMQMWTKCDEQYSIRHPLKYTTLKLTYI